MMCTSCTPGGARPRQRLLACGILILLALLSYGPDCRPSWLASLLLSTMRASLSFSWLQDVVSFSPKQVSLL